MLVVLGWGIVFSLLDVFDVPNWLELAHVAELSEIQWRLLVRSRCPKGYQPPVSCVAILPIMTVLRATGADRVQNQQENAQRGADGDGGVERREVPVNV